MTILKQLKFKIFCCYCNESDPCCIEFHHVIPKTKEFTITKAFKTHNPEIIKHELEKVIPLCSNCHKKVHAGVILCTWGTREKDMNLYLRSLFYLILNNLLEV